ncbi:MAG: LURP-one-related family protein [Luteolibacter sp.]
MRFVMKQKFWSLGDDFVIRDENGNDCYIVDGRAFSFGNQLSIRDMQGNELATIRERLLSWGPTYEIAQPGQAVTVVKKEHFTFFYCKFEIDGPGSQNYEASGDFLDHEYEIQSGYGTAATISKTWFSWTDTYGIEIADHEETILLLATVVVIDLICHDENGKS